MLHSKQTILTIIFWKHSSLAIKRNHSQFDTVKTMRVRGDWIHPCKSVYYVWHPATCEESEVYTAYGRRHWRGREFKLLRPWRR